VGGSVLTLFAATIEDRQQILAAEVVYRPQQRVGSNITVSTADLRLDGVQADCSVPTPSDFANG